MGAASPRQCVEAGAWVYSPACLALRCSTEVTSEERNHCSCSYCCLQSCRYWRKVGPTVLQNYSMSGLTQTLLDWMGYLPGNYSTWNSPWHRTSWRKNKISGTWDYSCCLWVKGFLGQIVVVVVVFVLLLLLLLLGHVHWILMPLEMKSRHGISCKSGKEPNHLTAKPKTTSKTTQARWDIS